MNLLAWGLAVSGGAVLGASIASYLLRPVPSQTELMYQNVALTFVADTAMGHLSTEERQQVQAEVVDQMKEAFGEDVVFEVQEEQFGGDDGA